MIQTMNKTNYHNLNAAINIFMSTALHLPHKNFKQSLNKVNAHLKDVFPKNLALQKFLLANSGCLFKKFRSR